MSAGGPSTITLRALSGEPLRDGTVRDMVIATAHAIAERQGIRVVKLDAAFDAITATLEADRVASLGFAAELRRLTGNWYRHKFDGATLWGEPPRHDEPGEAWKGQ